METRVKAFSDQELADQKQEHQRRIEKDPGRRAFRHLAEAVGEVIESQLHEGGARSTRLASAELHLTAAFEAIEPEHEPDCGPDGDGKGSDD